MNSLVRWLAGFALGLPAVVLPTQAQVAGYPNKPIRILVPFSPGGGADLMARLVTTRMSDKLGQPFVVDNRPAAGGIVATELAARAAPDGYTLLACTSNHAGYRSEEHTSELQSH